MGFFLIVNVMYMKQTFVMASGIWAANAYKIALEWAKKTGPEGRQSSVLQIRCDRRLDDSVQFKSWSDHLVDAIHQRDQEGFDIAVYR